MNDLSRVIGKVTHSDGEGAEAHWLSISDLMAGLMMVFLFIAIALMMNANIERDKIKEVAVAYQQSQVNIFDALMREFEKDLKRWDANIDRETLSFEFRSPEVLFEQGDIQIKPLFQKILNDFFPRYIQTLSQFKGAVNEIRVEGHTSSEWQQGLSETEAYFRNMELSQSRTRSVLRYVYELRDVEIDRPWIKKTFAAVGFSSAHIKFFEGTVEEDKVASRRVSFRVITNAETQIRKIIEDD